MAPPKTGRTPESKILACMVHRCTNPNNTHYHYYGGRGIKVCERWRVGGVLAFLEDMGPRPSANHEIDRINTDGDYEPGNCRWVTSKENSRNRRCNRYIEYQGESLCMTAFAEKYGLTVSSVKGRLASGWTLDEIVSIPLGKQKPKTHCRHGHAYTPENTYVNSRGFVVCRRCTLDRCKRRPSRAKEKPQ